MPDRLTFHPREIVWRDGGYWMKHDCYSATAANGMQSTLYSVMNPFWLIEALVGWLKCRHVLGHIENDMLARGDPKEK